MTHSNERRRGPWIGKTVTAIFLLVLGALANQFWNIPRQDYRMQSIEQRMEALDKHLTYNDQRLDAFGAQHAVISEQLEVLRSYHEPKAKEAKKR